MVDSNNNLTEKIYAFTNENLTGFESLYNFANADVLTVLGSGDQYFTSILFGAKSVEVYDTNLVGWFHFVLKFYSIKILSFEDFHELFIRSHINNFVILKKVLPYLPYDILLELEKILREPYGFPNILLFSPLSDFQENYESGRIIPYLDKEKYYALQNKLRNTNLPKFYHRNITDLPQELRNKTHDLLLTSNIYKWLMMTPQEYDKLLKKFNVPTIQTLYTWHYDKNITGDFLNLGYQIDTVEPTDPHERESKNFVITKRN